MAAPPPFSIELTAWPAGRKPAHSSCCPVLAAAPRGGQPGCPALRMNQALLTAPPGRPPLRTQVGRCLPLSGLLCMRVAGCTLLRGLPTHSCLLVNWSPPFVCEGRCCRPLAPPMCTHARTRSPPGDAGSLPPPPPPPLLLLLPDLVAVPELRDVFGSSRVSVYDGARTPGTTGTSTVPATAHDVTLGPTAGGGEGARGGSRVRAGARSQSCDTWPCLFTGRLKCIEITQAATLQGGRGGGQQGRGPGSYHVVPVGGGDRKSVV